MTIRLPRQRRGNDPVTAAVYELVSRANAPAATTGGTGPQGPQGPQGAIGSAGPQGPQGPSGSTGPQGAQGPQGSTGAAGTNANLRATRNMYGVNCQPGGTTRTAWGVATFSPTGTASNADTNARSLQRLTSTAATSGTLFGFNMTTAQTVRRGYNPAHQFTVSCADVTSIGLIGGLSTSGQDFVQTNTSCAMFRYDTSVDGTAFWRVVHNDGSGVATIVATSVAVTNGTLYDMEILLTSSDIRFYINGTLVHTATSDLPAATANLNPMQWGVCRANATRSFDFGSMMVRHPHGE